jgi:response regulator NasT
MRNLPENDKLRVLVVDETAQRAALLHRALAECGHEVAACTTTTANLHEQVQRLMPDVIIIDTESPDRDTLEHICLVSESEPRPIVMFTDERDAGKIREAVRAGVSAYVVDGLAPERIRPIIDAAVARFQEYHALKDELRQANARLAERKLIERAKGILMNSRRLTEEQAYRTLRRLAMDKKLRLAAVAEQVISIAELLA